MRRLLRMTVILGLAFVLTAGCGAAGDGGGGSEPAASTPEPAAPVDGPTEAAANEADTIFSTRCFTCHGKVGAGDGPGSAGLTPPPRNLQDPEWQASVTDDHIGNIILYGGAAVGRSPMMPGNPDLIAKADVVAALVEHIRKLAPR